MSENKNIEYPEIMDEIMEELSFVPEESRGALVGLFTAFLMMGMF